jgi:hypothetical protein
MGKHDYVLHGNTQRISLTQSQNFSQKKYCIPEDTSANIEDLEVNTTHMGKRTKKKNVDFG